MLATGFKKSSFYFFFLIVFEGKIIYDGNIKLIIIPLINNHEFYWKYPLDLRHVTTN